MMILKFLDFAITIARVHLALWQQFSKLHCAISQKKGE